jgi:DNA-binding transcriptional regulator YhcF (GntR family)
VPAGLNLTVDRASDVPLGTQLTWKLRTLIATGALAPGAKLPGIREVAESASVNVNTVRSVFARLEDQGLLVSEQGRGTFVAANARLDASLTEAAAETIANALAAGIDPRELAAALYVSDTRPSATRPDAHVSGGAGSPPATDPRGERRSLYSDIERLEREVARLDPLTPLEARPQAVSQPRVLSIAELRETRDNLLARVDQLARERQQWRAESEQIGAAAREPAQRGYARPWRAGIWTGHAGAAVSWTS